MNLYETASFSLEMPDNVFIFGRYGIDQANLAHVPPRTCLQVVRFQDLGKMLLRFYDSI